MAHKNRKHRESFADKVRDTLKVCSTIVLIMGCVYFGVLILADKLVKKVNSNLQDQFSTAQNTVTELPTATQAPQQLASAATSVPTAEPTATAEPAGTAVPWTGAYRRDSLSSQWRAVVEVSLFRMGSSRSCLPQQGQQAACVAPAVPSSRRPACRSRHAEICPVLAVRQSVLPVCEGALPSQCGRN